jgi:hypothetical protein
MEITKKIIPVRYLVNLKDNVRLCYTKQVIVSFQGFCMLLEFVSYMKE